MADLVVVAGDTLPPIDALIIDNGVPVDLAGATVAVTVLSSSGTVLVAAAPCTVDPAVPGRVLRPWAAGETAVPDNATATFIVTTSAGRRTYPTGDPFSIAFAGPHKARRTMLDPDQVAAEFGIATLTNDTRVQLASALAAAVASVELYLRRGVVVGVYTEAIYGYTISNETISNPPLVRQITAVADSMTGLVTATYVGGLDGASIGPIREWVAATAVNLYYNRKINPTDRIPQSVTVEGQSVSFSGTLPVPAPVESLHRWRLESRSVWTRPRHRDPFTYAPYV